MNAGVLGGWGGRTQWGLTCIICNVSLSLTHATELVSFFFYSEVFKMNGSPFYNWRYAGC